MRTYYERLVVILKLRLELSVGRQIDTEGPFIYGRIRGIREGLEQSGGSEK